MAMPEIEGQNQFPAKDTSEWTYRQVREWALQNLFPRMFDVEVDGVKGGLTISTKSVIFSPVNGASRGCDISQIRAIRIVNYDTAEIMYSAAGKIESIIARSTEGWRPKLKSVDPGIEYYDAPVGRSYTFAQYISEVSDADVVDHYGSPYGRIALSEFEERIRQAREMISKIDREHKEYFRHIYLSPMAVLQQSIWGFAKYVIPISRKLMMDIIDYEARRKMHEVDPTDERVKKALDESIDVLLLFGFTGLKG
jgi:hypothetical protein